MWDEININSMLSLNINNENIADLNFFCLTLLTFKVNDDEICFLWQLSATTEAGVLMDSMNINVHVHLVLPESFVRSIYSTVLQTLVSTMPNVLI